MSVFPYSVRITLLFSFPFDSYAQAIISRKNRNEKGISFGLNYELAKEMGNSIVKLVYFYSIVFGMECAFNWGLACLFVCLGDCFVFLFGGFFGRRVVCLSWFFLNKAKGTLFLM